MTLAEEQSARDVEEWKVNLRKVREWRRNQAKIREYFLVANEGYGCWTPSARGCAIYEVAVWSKKL